MHSFVDEGQLRKLEKAMNQTVHILQFMNTAKCETRVNLNATISYSNTAFVTVN